MANFLVMSGGGIKSAVAAARYAKDHHLVFLHLDYGQPSAAAEHKAIVGLMPAFPKARLMRLSLPHVLELNRGVVEHSKPGVVQAAALTDSVKNSDAAVLPASLRGLAPVMLSVGVQAALRLSADGVVVGIAGSGDAAHLGLSPVADPNARHEFIHAFAVACHLGLGGGPGMKIEAPMMDLSMAQMLQLGLRLEVPFEQTWSCHLGGPRPCGRCSGCKQRARSFAEIARLDPLLAGAANRPARSTAAQAR